MHTPKYRRRPDRNYAFVEYKGERIRLPGRYGSRESKRAYAEFLASLAGDSELEKPQFGDVSVGELVASFVSYAKAHYRDSDQAEGSREYRHLNAILSVFEEFPEICNMAVSDFGPRLLREIQKAFVSQGWSRNYCNAQTSRVRRVFKWGVGREVVQPETAAALTFVEPLREGRTEAKETESVKCVPGYTVLEVAGHAGTVVGAMLRLHLLTGMRPQNICNISPEQIDISGKMWLFRPTVHKNAWRVEKNKKHKLVIPLGPKAQSVLGPFMDRPKDMPCFSPREAEEERLGSCANRKERAPRDAYDTATYGRAVKWAIKRANKARIKRFKNFKCYALIENFSPGQIRHTFATKVRAKSGLEAAQALLGHSSADTTQIYAEKNIGLAKKIAQEIG